MVDEVTQKILTPYDSLVAVEPAFQYNEDDLTGDEIDKMEPQVVLFDTIVFKEKGSKLLEEIFKSDSSEYKKQGSVMVRPCGYNKACRDCGTVQRKNIIIQKGDSVSILCSECAVEIIEGARKCLKQKKNQILHYDDSEFIVYNLDEPMKIRDIITGDVKETSNPVVLHPDSKIEVNLHPDYKFAIDITDMEELAEGILNLYDCDFVETRNHPERECQICLNEKRRTYMIGHENSNRMVNICSGCSLNIAQNMRDYVELNEPEIISTII